MPASKVLVARGNEREAIIHGDLMRGERKAKAGLREGGHRSAKRVGERLGNVIGHTNRKEGSLVIIDGEPSGIFKELQDLFSLGDSISRAPKEN